MRKARAAAKKNYRQNLVMMFDKALAEDRNVYIGGERMLTTLDCANKVFSAKVGEEVEVGITSYGSRMVPKMMVFNLGEGT